MQFQFENFALDLDRRELSCGDSIVPIEPKTFDLLVYLISNQERVISKDELVESIWQGRIVSDSAVASCINAARAAIGDSGTTQRLIRTLPRKGLRFVGDARVTKTLVAASLASANKVLALPDKPSIAVLPFAHLSSDPEQAYFADGIVEEIITALSRMKALFVIARNSSFTFKGRAVDARQVGRELGVRYLLEGSVRKSGNRVRIAGQLIDTATGIHLWAERFDGGLEDVFDLQDQLTSSVVGAIAPKLEQAEIERSRRKPTESLDAYDYYLRGLAAVHRWTNEANIEALTHFYNAIERDQEFATAYGLAARCYSQRKAIGAIAVDDRQIGETRRLANRAAELGQDDAVALCTAGLAISFVVGQYEEGVALTDRAIELNPNLAWALYFGGWAKNWVGEPHVAIERLSRAMRLSPNDPQMWGMQDAMCSAQFSAGNYDESLSWAKSALLLKPDSILPLIISAASASCIGRDSEAEDRVKLLLLSDPSIRIAGLNQIFPEFHKAETFAKFSEALRRAGLPD